MLRGFISKKENNEEFNKLSRIVDLLEIALYNKAINKTF